ncbi:hypothetical protein EON67_11710 [archaeon]|nr:MAG: hypothetical protein EON67_11710 [archaeon]
MREEKGYTTVSCTVAAQVLFSVRPLRARSAGCGGAARILLRRPCLAPALLHRAWGGPVACAWQLDQSSARAIVSLAARALLSHGAHRIVTSALH